MNNVFYFIGRITKDLELKETQSGKRMVELPLAIDNGKDDTTFVKVLVFNATAESIVKYQKKGNLIGVSGYIKNNNWEDDKGIRHYDLTFLANKVTYLYAPKKEEKEEVKEEVDPYEEFGKETQVSIDDNFLD